MLYPQQNDVRNLLDLSGFWDFKLDPDEAGEREGWFDGLAAARTIAVPASWNELFQDTRDYLGMAWYARTFYVPQGWRGQRIYLRIGSANYAARAWVNGQFVGEHSGGHLPFAFEVTEQVAWGAPNTVAIQVEGKLTPTRVPPGNVNRGGAAAFMAGYPNTSSKEYQVAFLRGYLDVAAERPYVAGLHVWNFADFKTGQGTRRAGGLNLKGVFTRDRQPKMAAHFLRERWTGQRRATCRDQT